MASGENLNLNSISENTFTPQLNANETALEGLRLHKQGKVNKARALYLDAINHGCDNKESVLANLGVALKQLKDYQASEKAYREVLSINPKNLSANANLASLYLEIKDYDKSIALAKATLEIKPNHLETIVNLGLCLAYTKEFEEAKRVFNKCIQLAPSMAEGYIFLAETQSSSGNIQAAKEVLTKAINKVTNKSKVNTQLGKLSSATKDYKQAITFYEAALREDPDNHILSGEITRLKFITGIHDDDDEKITEKLSNESRHHPSTLDYLLEDNNSDQLLIIFSSNGRSEKITNNEPPSFNFKNYLSESCNFDKLFIRDVSRQYYVRNLGTSSKNIHDTVELIKKLTSRKKYTKKIAIGASAGGFAAILFANLLRLDKAIAFNPQTVLSEEKESIINDLHFTVNKCRELRKLDSTDSFYQKCLNLKNFIPFECDVDIHYSSESTNHIDKRHAEHIKHKNCKLIEHESSTHLLALELKDRGKLKQIILEPLTSRNRANSRHQRALGKAKGFGC